MTKSHFSPLAVMAALGLVFWLAGSPASGSWCLPEEIPCEGLHGQTCGGWGGMQGCFWELSGQGCCTCYGGTWECWELGPSLQTPAGPQPEEAAAARTEIPQAPAGTADAPRERSPR